MTKHLDVLHCSACPALCKLERAYKGDAQLTQKQARTMQHRFGLGPAGHIVILGDHIPVSASVHKTIDRVMALVMMEAEASSSRVYHASC